MMVRSLSLFLICSLVSISAFSGKVHDLVRAGNAGPVLEYLNNDPDAILELEEGKSVFEIVNPDNEAMVAVLIAFKQEEKSSVKTDCGICYQPLVDGKTVMCPSCFAPFCTSCRDRLTQDSTIDQETEMDDGRIVVTKDPLKLDSKCPMCNTPVDVRDFPNRQFSRHSQPSASEREEKKEEKEKKEKKEKREEKKEEKQDDKSLALSDGQFAQALELAEHAGLELGDFIDLLAVENEFVNLSQEIETRHAQMMRNQRPRHSPHVNHNGHHAMQPVQPVVLQPVVLQPVLPRVNQQGQYCPSGQCVTITALVAVLISISIGMTFGT